MRLSLVSVVLVLCGALGLAWASSLLFEGTLQPKIDDRHMPPYSYAEVLGSLRYVVQDGDTIASIAQRLDTTEEQIRRANGLVESSEIKAGDLLLINPRMTSVGGSYLATTSRNWRLDISLLSSTGSSLGTLTVTWPRRIKRGGSGTVKATIRLGKPAAKVTDGSEQTLSTPTPSSTEHAGEVLGITAVAISDFQSISTRLVSASFIIEAVQGDSFVAIHPGDTPWGWSIRPQSDVNGAQDLLLAISGLTPSGGRGTIIPQLTISVEVDDSHAWPFGPRWTSEFPIQLWLVLAAAMGFLLREAYYGIRWLGKIVLTSKFRGRSERSPPS